MQNKRSDTHGSQSSPSRPETSIITYSARLDAVNAEESSPSGKRHTLHVCAATAAYSAGMAERCGWPAGLQKLISQLGKSNSLSKSP